MIYGYEAAKKDCNGKLLRLRIVTNPSFGARKWEKMEGVKKYKYTVMKFI